MDAFEEREAGELRLKTLVASLPNLVWSLKPDGSCDYVSPQWMQYAGGELGDYLGLGWVEIIHPDDRERLIAEWQRSSPLGRPYDVEARLRSRDGSYRWFKTRGLPLADAEGQVVRWYGSNTDIDDVKRAEQKLRTQLEKLALLDATTRAINARQDVASILNVVAQSLEDGLGIDFVCCCLLDTPGGQLRVSAMGPNSTTLGPTLGLVAGEGLAVDENGMSRCLRGSSCTSPISRGFHLPLRNGCRLRVSIHWFWRLWASMARCSECWWLHDGAPRASAAAIASSCASSVSTWHLP